MNQGVVVVVVVGSGPRSCSITHTRYCAPYCRPVCTRMWVPVSVRHQPRLPRSIRPRPAFSPLPHAHLRSHSAILTAAQTERIATPPALYPAKMHMTEWLLLSHVRHRASLQTCTVCGCHSANQRMQLGIPRHLSYASAKGPPLAPSAPFTVHQSRAPWYRLAVCVSSEDSSSSLLVGACRWAAVTCITLPTLSLTGLPLSG